MSLNADPDALCLLFVPPRKVYLAKKYKNVMQMRGRESGALFHYFFPVPYYFSKDASGTMFFKKISEVKASPRSYLSFSMGTHK